MASKDCAVKDEAVEISGAPDESSLKCSCRWHAASPVLLWCGTS
jgi:hypothetical protein